MDQFTTFTGLFGWYTTPDPAPVSQHHSSVSGTIKPPTHNHSEDCHVPSSGPVDNWYFRHLDAGSVNTATMVSNEVSSPFNLLHGYSGHLEVGLASSLSQFGLSVDGGDPLPAEGSSTYTPALLHYLLQPNELESPTTSPTFTSVNTNTPFELSSFQSDRSLIPSTRDVSRSWMLNLNESGVFSTSTLRLPNRSIRDNHAATASLGTRSINSTSSSQTSVTSRSNIYPTNMPPNHCGSIDPLSDNGDRLAPSDFGFRSAKQVRRHTTAVSPMASDQVLAPRQTSKRYWCKICDTSFAQRQVLRRHHKDMHCPRLYCPLCGDFEWSSGRKYALRNHFKAKHPGVTLPEFLHQQGPDS